MPSNSDKRKNIYYKINIHIFGIMKQDARRKVTNEIMEKMRKLRKEGLAYAKIADEFNLSIMTVYNYLKKEEKGVEKEEKVSGKQEKVGFIEGLKRKLGWK